MRTGCLIAVGVLTSTPSFAQPASQVVSAHDYRAVVGGLGLRGLSGPKPWAVVGTSGMADWRCAPVEVGTLCAAVSNGIIVSVQRWCPTVETGWEPGCSLWTEAAQRCPSGAASIQVRLDGDRLVQVADGQRAECGDGLVVAQVVLAESGLSGLLSGWSLAESSSLALTLLNRHIPMDAGPRLEPLPPGVASAPVPRHLPKVSPGQPIEPVVTGPLAVDEVSRVFAAHKTALAACRPKTQGGPGVNRVLLDFVIEVDGSVSSAVVRASDLDNAQAERCVVERVTAWAFAAPTGPEPVRVSYAVPL